MICHRPARPGSRAERGSGTVLALGLGLVLVAVCWGVVLLGQALVASARAAAAADLSALAAADAERGLRSGAACAIAREVAELNGAALVGCDVEAEARAVRVRVEVPTPWAPAAGRARAGPPPDDVTGLGASRR